MREGYLSIPVVGFTAIVVDFSLLLPVDLKRRQPIIDTTISEALGIQLIEDPNCCRVHLLLPSCISHFFAPAKATLEPAVLDRKQAKG